MASFPLRSRRDYELPLLEALQEIGGSATPGDELYQRVADKLGLTSQDTEFDIVHARDKWVYTLQWVRYNLVQQGDLDGSKRGLWALTEQGRQRLIQRGIAKGHEQSAPFEAVLLDSDKIEEAVSRSMSKVFERQIDILRTLQLDDLLRVLDFYRFSLDPAFAPDLVERMLTVCMSAHDPQVFAQVLLKPISDMISGGNAIRGDILAVSYWEELTGDADFFALLLRLIQDRNIDGRISYKTVRAMTYNRLLYEFTQEFIGIDWTIDWEKLTRASLAARSR